MSQFPSENGVNGHLPTEIPALDSASGLLPRLARFGRTGVRGIWMGLRAVARSWRAGKGFIYENRWILLVFALLLLPAWVKGINLLLLLSLLVISMWGVNWVIAGRQLRRLKCSRLWHGAIHAGREAHWEIKVQNNDRRPSHGFRLIDAGHDHQSEWFVDRLEPGETILLNASVVLPRRGPYRLTPLMALSLYPFGVAHRRRRVGELEECLVLPRLGRLNSARFERWLSQRAWSDVRTHHVARPSMLHQDDLHGLRPFRAGDNPRWIHWRTSARKNQKMVREFEQDTSQELVILVEPYSSNPEQLDPRLESAISLAATICMEWNRLGGDRLQLGILGPKPGVVTRGNGGENGFELLRCLARVVGAPSIDTAPLLKLLPAPSARTTPIVVITPLANSPTVARLTRTWNRPVHGLNPEAAREFYEETAPVEKTEVEAHR